MDFGSLVYSNTGITSSSGVVNIGSHTNAIHLCNLNSTTSASVNLNGRYTVLCPHTPSQSSARYIQIFGDYTTVEVLTANCTIALFAIG